MGEQYQLSEDLPAIFRALAGKFATNLEASLTATEGRLALSNVELKARAFTVVASILRGTQNLSETQQRLLDVFDELFSDTICSIFLAASALDKPAQMVLRRVLELGVGVVYLWDLPHRFWGWRTLDQDLSYAEMLEHLNSPAYKAYLFPSQTTISVPDLVDLAVGRSLYRVLSNTVHAKMVSFETSLADRFTYTSTDWLDHLNLVCKVEDLLLSLWKARFPGLTSSLYSVMPQLGREDNTNG
jgi:hypothetical protein